MLLIYLSKLKTVSSLQTKYCTVHVYIMGENPVFITIRCDWFDARVEPPKA